MELRRGQIITPPVNGIKVINHRKCYIVTLDDGRQYPITLMRFQLEEETPARIKCLVKDINRRTGDITLIQDLAPHLRRFYKINGVYDFTVIKPKLNTQNREYLVSDNYGFCFPLKTKEDQILYSHQHIRCRVKEISGTHLGLKLENEQNQLIHEKANNLLTQINELLDAKNITHLDKTSFIKLLFDNKGEQSFDEECSNWLQELLWNKAETVTQILEEINEVSLYLLENSDILKRATSAEREMLQDRLSASIDISQRFLEALEIRNNGEEENYIDTLLEKLDRSGYIYQPQHKLGVLVTLFTLNLQLMDNRMSDIFRIIHNSPLEYWKQEPFRTAFIKLLEMYIRAARDKADFSSTNSIESVELIIKALSIELCLVQTLADEQAKVLPCDLRLNRAMLFRYASYFATQAPRALLESSFNNIMGVGVDKMLFSWEDTKNVEILCNKLSTVDEREDDENDYALTMQIYKGEHAIIRIGDGGIQIMPTIEDDDCEPVLPDDLLTWHQQQIFVNGGISSHIKKEDLNNYKKIWTEINAALTHGQSEVKPKKEPIKVFPDKGDIVEIRIDRMAEEDNRTLMHCIIESETTKGEGTITLDSIVDWNPALNEDSFNDDMGNQLCFEAKVVTVNADGVCTFNMKELIKQHVYDSDDVYYGRKFIMLVKSVKGNGLNGVSKEGYPLNATIPQDVDDVVKVGDYIECILDQEYKRNRGNISTTYVRQYGQCIWNETDAFRELLGGYSYGTWRDKNAEEKEALQLDSQLDRTYVRELMLLMDRQAAVESTIRSYSYLGMARTLATIIDDKQSAQYYEGRMELLKMLDEFSINEVVDGAKLSEFEKLSPQTFQTGSQLRMRFKQLQIISYRGITSHNHELWEITSNESDTGLRDLASLVLSENMLKQFNLGHLNTEINAKIFEILKIKQHTSSHKNYGKESKNVEFKTSMVYPPENSMRPDLVKQTNTILKVVCAFLNTEGGTLYIGVNNEGTAVGIDNDIAYKQFKYSTDKYDIYFHNAIKKFLGIEANSLVDTRIEDNEDGTSVYIVEVRPCQNVIELGGTVYERQSTSCEPLTGEYLETFKASRRPSDISVPEATEEIHPEPEPVEEPKTVAKKKDTQKTISTSQIRNNVLLSWEENFEEPVAYIQFLPNAKYQLIDECFDDTDTELTIAIHENEVNGYLILAYEDGHVAKVSLKEILEKEKYKQYQRCESKLMFACPASDSDLLFSVVKGSNGDYFYYRTDYISQMEKENITSEGTLLYTLLDYSILQADIVPNKDNSIYMATPGRALGVSTVKGDGRTLKQKIEELGIEVCL